MQFQAELPEYKLIKYYLYYTSFHHINKYNLEIIFIFAKAVLSVIMNIEGFKGDLQA